MGFAAHQLLGESAVAFLQMRADKAVLSGQIWRLVTGVFVLPSDLLTVGAVVLLLWLFGRRLETSYSNIDVLTFYVAAAAVASLIWSAAAMMWAETLLLHCVGSVTALVVLALLKEPLLTFRAGPISCPGFAVILLCIGIDLRYFSWYDWALNLPAHIGGALFALVYFQFDLRITRLIAKEALPLEHQGTKSYPSDHAMDVVPIPADLRPLEDKVDEVLAKISVSGENSLSDEERELLRQAAQQYKQRHSPANGVD